MKFEVSSQASLDLLTDSNSKKVTLIAKHADFRHWVKRQERWSWTRGNTRLLWKWGGYSFLVGRTSCHARTRLITNHIRTNKTKTAQWQIPKKESKEEEKSQTHPIEDLVTLEVTDRRTNSSTMQRLTTWVDWEGGGLQSFRILGALHFAWCSSILSWLRIERVGGCKVLGY